MEDEDSDPVPDKFDLVKIGLETMPLDLLARRVDEYAIAKDWQFASMASVTLAKRAIVMTDHFYKLAAEEQAQESDDS